MRSWPSMPPTRALTATSSANWAAFGAQPEPDRAAARSRGGLILLHGTRRRYAPVTRAGRGARPVLRPADAGQPTSTCPARSSRLAAAIARSPWPHITTVGRSGSCATRSARAPSSMCRAPGRWPAAELAVLADVEDLHVPVPMSGSCSARDERSMVVAARPRARRSCLRRVRRRTGRGRPCGPARRSPRGPGRDCGTTTSGTPGGHEPAEPRGERRSQRDRQCSGDVRVGVVVTGRTSTTIGPAVPELRARAPPVSGASRPAARKSGPPGRGG